MFYEKYGNRTEQLPAKAKKLEHNPSRRQVAKWLILRGKKLPSSFTGVDLVEWQREHDIEKVAICGYMTQICCDTTARQAFHLGFQVDFFSDATGTLSIQNSAGAISDCDLHRAVLVTMAMKFARVVKAEEWITKTEKR
jgi:nicotinamidase-related amidase